MDGRDARGLRLTTYETVANCLVDHITECTAGSPGLVMQLSGQIVIDRQRRTHATHHSAPKAHIMMRDTHALRLP